MALDDNPDEVFDNEPELESNGDETSNRSFRYMMIGLFAIGALGVLLIGLIFISKQNSNAQFASQQLSVQQTNEAVIALSQITPTPLPTDTPAPTNTAVPANKPLSTLIPGKQNLVDTALAAGNLKTLATLLESAGLADVLKGQDPYTIFAPTDSAFAQVSPESLDALKIDPEKLKAFLKYHVVQGALKPSDMATQTELKTLDGIPLAIAANDGLTTVNGVKVGESGSESSNGVIYPIDSVLVPPDMKQDVLLVPAPSATTVASGGATAAPGSQNLVDTAITAGNFKTLSALLEATGLSQVLKGQDPYTIFAPTDSAFAQVSPESLAALKKDPKKLEELLKYHVVQGALKPSDMATQTELKTLGGVPIAIAASDGSTTVSGEKLTAPVESSNGVIYPIDSVLVPPDMKQDVLLVPAPSATTVASGGSTAVPGSQNLVDTAIAAGKFKTLSALLEAAGLSQVLKGDGAYTIFAPTDSAFAQVSPESLAALKKDPKKLEELLKYHVVQGALKPSDMATQTELKTLGGVPIAIAANDGSTTVSGEKLTAPVESSNGVIYPIDSVLVPPDMKQDVLLVPAPSATTVASGGATAVPGSQNLVDTAITAGNFKTLSALLEAAGLSQVLKGDGAYTIFAPTDSAFAQVSPESLAALKQDPKKLEELLKYHVVKGALKPSDMTAQTELKTLGGVPIAIAANDGSTTVNGVRVGGSGSESSNGVIYPIDSVLVPPGMKDVVIVQALPATAQPGKATPAAGKGTAIAQVQGTVQANAATKPASGGKATAVPGAQVLTRVPPGPGTVAPSGGITSTKPISGTTGQGLPTTGAGEDIFLLFLAAICLMMVIFAARRLRTMPR